MQVTYRTTQCYGAGLTALRHVGFSAIKQLANITGSAGIYSGGYSVSQPATAVLRNRTGLCKGCPQQQDLSRVVDPKQHARERARRAVAGDHLAGAEVETDEAFTTLKGKRRHHSTAENIAPSQSLIRQYFVNRREESRGEGKGSGRAQHGQYPRAISKMLIDVSARRVDAAIDNQRHKEQEPEAGDQPYACRPPTHQA